MINRCVAVVLLVLPAWASAWDARGHKVVAAVAEQRLSPAAWVLVRELVGEEPMFDPEVATWADTQQPRSGHYVTIPFGASYNEARDCARGCAVEMIAWAAAELRHDGEPRRRADALRWLVHAVADLHQPLHAGDPWDRGGTLLTVRAGSGRATTSFHDVWDAEVLRPFLDEGVEECAARLLASAPSAEVEAWATVVDPAAWANESSATARQLYAELGRSVQDKGAMSLPADYVERQQWRTSERLLRAGVRLAALLDVIARERQVIQRRGASTIVIRDHSAPTTNSVSGRQDP